MNRTVSMNEFVEVVVQLLPFFWRWDENRLGRTMSLAERQYHASFAQRRMSRIKHTRAQDENLFDLSLLFPVSADRTHYIPLESGNLENPAFVTPTAPRARVVPTWRTVTDDDLRRRLEEAENNPMTTLREIMVRNARIILASNPTATGDEMLEAVNVARKTTGMPPYESANSCPDVFSLARAQMGITYGGPGRPRVWHVNRFRYRVACLEVGCTPLDLHADEGFTWTHLSPEESQEYLNASPPADAPVVPPPAPPAPAPRTAPTAVVFLSPKGNTPTPPGGYMADGSAPPPPKDRVAPEAAPTPAPTPAPVVSTTPAVLPSDPVEAALATFKATLAAHDWRIASIKVDLERVERRTIGG